MSEQKLSQKWCIAAFFKELTVGYEFDQSSTPLHATLAGIFAYPAKGEAIAKVLQQSTAQTSRFSVVGLKAVQWGEALTVTLLQQSADFNALYRTMQDDLSANGADFNEPEYLGDGFTPHVTVQKSEKLEPDESRLIQNVSLVDMFPGGDGYRRRIHTVIRLSNGNE